MQFVLSVLLIDDIINGAARPTRQRTDKPIVIAMDDGTKHKRPRSVTIFSLVVLLLGSGLNLTRAVWALRQANALTDLPQSTSMPMTWLSVTSLVWGLAFAICGFGLWRLRPWGRVATLVVVTLYHVNVWFNHIVFDRSDFARQVWPFAIVNSLVVLIVVWFFLSWPTVRRLYEID
jgi:uncharacterized membrane protein (DUF2068 family)